ncbi:excinuclease ABC subunit UvrA [Flavobacteriaceae bacterium]|nr:excinuclease ABC subunit UvrA [Flavobacteriaceae bacterium]MDC1061045.1 excinuclease ABC subunit UvrA [Flavobacteriaceae bacterium]
MKEIKQLSPKDYIIILGAKLHNLKNIDVAIKRNSLSVITGLSGSGKSSLAFDTLYAEGQRRYVESLSSYARQFMGRLNKPKVDQIKGIAPAIAVEQKVNASNPRSTVGTKTEIYDYLKLLFARVGETYSPISNNKVTKDNVSDVVDFILKQEENNKYLLLTTPKTHKKRTQKEVIAMLIQQGYARIYANECILRLDELNGSVPKEYELIVDRIIVRQNDEDFKNRLSDAVDIALFEGDGYCELLNLKSGERTQFSNKFEADGLSFVEPNVHLFSFNNPFGACEKCEGYGDIVGVDPELVIPNNGLSIYEEAIAPWRGSGFKKYYSDLINNAYQFDFPLHKPYFELTEEQKTLVWKGNSYFAGLHAFFNKLEKKNYKIQNRVLLSRYRGKTKCDACNGTRLRPETAYVKINGKSLPDLMHLSLDDLAHFFDKLTLNEQQHEIARRLLVEINSRLSFMQNVGLGYLTLNRKSNSLSGGESQRINLATSLGSSLVGSMYILDEPSIGLHSRDNERLIQILHKLKALGNTVIVVEHDEEIMRAADEIIDIGPEAGTLGGEVVGQGSFDEIIKKKTLTAQYLNGTMKIEVPSKRRKSKNQIRIIGARENNLKNINVSIPLNCFTAITGVSGSGKSTLVKKILYPALQRHLDVFVEKPGQFDGFEGDFSTIKQVEYIDQNPIGRSSRSNPVTYIKAYDEIRSLFAHQSLSKVRGFQPKHFSFNVDGGRCDACKGEGSVTIEMQFMADVILACEHCKGKRFKKEVREVLFEDKSIDQILEMTVDDAIAFFELHKQTKLARKLFPLQRVGLGYVALGQSSATLSGGEAQRIKLASFIGKGEHRDKILFIFDEPTTGLHFHDIKKLLTSFEALLDKGHSLIVVEHNMDLIKCADHIIDLGPEGGQHGGTLVGEGTPEEIAEIKNSYTGNYLKEKLNA